MRIVKATQFNGKEIALDIDGIVSEEKIRHEFSDCIRIKTKHGAEYIFLDNNRRPTVIDRVLHL